MKKSLFVALLTSVLALNVMAADPKVIVPDSTGFTFTDLKVIKSTPVKDQDRSGTCWCYSTNTFFENEILRKTGKEVHLSEGFVVSHCYLDKAMKYIRMDGEINFAEGGAAHDVPYVWATYGMVPHEVYTGFMPGYKKFNTSELTSNLKGYVGVINERKLKKLTPAWIEGFKGILDAYMGKLPETFTYEGKTYTPQSYAASLPIDLNDYVAITSFTHHPFYKPFVLEVADNWLWGSFENVPLNELLEITNNAIDKGYTIAWGADVSEPGMKWRKGYAVLPVEKDVPDLEGSDLERWTQLSDKDREEEKWDIKGPVEEQVVTQELRQQMFDNKETTDDHGMVIVGKAVDQKGNRYFKVQNSWDTNQLYHGFFYVSEAYFLAKTMNIYLHKDAVPAKIAKKIGL
ncbi:MAG: aminopeptidase [Muribaculaceae bacterium]|jgi:bleomycin hydrolase|nr:aminopeptidase [Muribaculaceae bacterium]